MMSNIKIPYIDLKMQYLPIHNEIMDAISNCLNNGSFILRGPLQELESKLSDYLGVSHVIGLNSGTDALFLSLKALNIGAGDEVITVSHTFVATISAIVHCGAKPVLVDILEDGNIDVSLIEKNITKNTKAIIPVHMNGKACDMESIMEISRNYGISIIEDAAQAFGGSYGVKKLGSYGVTGCFSLHPMKQLSVPGDGGFVATSDDAIAERIRVLGNHGQQDKNTILEFGYNSRLDSLHAAVALVKLKYLDQYIARRREIARIYCYMLKNCKQVILPKISKNDTVSSFVIKVDDRDKLLSHLNNCGIECFSHWRTPNHLQNGLNLDNFKLNQTEKLSNTVISLPCYPEISNKEVKEVSNEILNYYYP
jgi:dTDP-4-amino-4,6-dideoxygalactose transaminase